MEYFQHGRIHYSSRQFILLTKVGKVPSTHFTVEKETLSPGIVDTQLLLKTITSGTGFNPLPWPTQKSLDAGQCLSMRSLGFLLDNLLVNFIPCILFRSPRNGMEIPPLTERHQPRCSTQPFLVRCCWTRGRRPKLLAKYIFCSM